MMLGLVVLVSVVRVLLLLLLTLTEVGLLPFGGLVIVLTEQFLTMFVPVLMLPFRIILKLFQNTRKDADLCLLYRDV